MSTPKARSCQGSGDEALFGPWTERSGFLLIVSQFFATTFSTDGSVVDSIRLFRAFDDDGGFFKRPTIHEFRDDLLIVYESGVMRINSLGHPLWHTQICWDDYVEGIDHERLLLSWEGDDQCRHRGVIDLDTGHIVRDPTWR